MVKVWSNYFFLNFFEFLKFLVKIWSNWSNCGQSSQTVGSNYSQTSQIMVKLHYLILLLHIHYCFFLREYIIITYSLLFTYIIVKKSIDNTDMWQNGILVNSIECLVLTCRYNHRSGRAEGWNREVKRAQGGAVWGWVTDREVWKIQRMGDLTEYLTRTKCN